MGALVREEFHFEVLLEGHALALDIFPYSCHHSEYHCIAMVGRSEETVVLSKFLSADVSSVRTDLFEIRRGTAVDTCLRAVFGNLLTSVDVEYLQRSSAYLSIVDLNGQDISRMFRKPSEHARDDHDRIHSLDFLVVHIYG